MYWTRKWKTTNSCKKCEYHGIPKNAKTSCVNSGTCIARKSGREGQIYTEILPTNQLYESNVNCNTRSHKQVIKSGLQPKKNNNYSFSYRDLLRKRRNTVTDKLPIKKPHSVTFPQTDVGKLDYGPDGNIEYPEHVSQGGRSQYGNELFVYSGDGQFIAKIGRNRKYQQTTGIEIDLEYWYWYENETYPHQVIMRHFPGEGLKIMEQTFLEAVTASVNGKANLLSHFAENGGYKLYDSELNGENSWFIRVIDAAIEVPYGNDTVLTKGNGGCTDKVPPTNIYDECQNATVWKPNNKQFHQQGAVDSSTRIDRLRLNTVAGNYKCPPGTVKNGNQAWNSCWNGNYLDTVRNTNEYNSGGAEWKYNDRLNNFELNKFPNYVTACHQEKTARRKVVGNIGNSFCLFPNN